LINYKKSILEPKASFTTIQSPTEGLYKEKGSKFIAHAFPVDTEEAIQARLEELRKRYYDARHICYAWILDAEGLQYRANDDGEPNHTAGDPILNQIRSFGYTRVLVAVVRYFGGTKLGASGLIHAYKTAAREALSVAEPLEKHIGLPVTFHLGYEAISEVMRIISDMEMQLINQSYMESITIETILPLGKQKALEEATSYIPGLDKVELGEEPVVY
jgi:uncharacterized YigZ family protein